MSCPLDQNWSPTPEQLAAYADGELPRDLRTKIDAWLNRHPQARLEVAELRKLRAIYDADVPPKPSAETWEALFERVLAGLPTAAQQAEERRRAWMRATAILVAAAVLLVAFGFWRRAGGERPSGDDVLLVATAAEIEIISIAGTDTHAVVVGEPPVRGTLELLAPGEVTVTRIEPSGRDNMRPQLRESPPMIWARLDTEVDD